MESDADLMDLEFKGPARRLLYHSLSTMNCTPSALEQFPSGLFSKELRQHGVIVLHLVITVYMFAALSIICHDYFVPAMERLAQVCGIEKNVVGASIMPAIASTPQLAVTVIGVFLVKDDIGLGSVVGSTFFNVLLVPGIFALVVKEAIRLEWWPVFRDCSFYLISVITLTVAMTDGSISLADSIVMVVVYILYLVVLFFNKSVAACATKVVNFFESHCCPGSTCLTTGQDDSLPADSEKRNLVNQMATGSSYMGTDDLAKDKSFSTPQYTPVEGSVKEDIPMKNKESEEPASESKELQECKKTQDGEEYRSIMSVPETTCKRIFWVLLLPVIVPIFICIPDCKRSGCWRSLYFLTILSSVFCIGITSYVLVWMMAIVGDTFEINDVVVGMTVLAIGGSLPDMLNSIFVAKDGFGDMALANSIGSNIFEMLFCLAVPWMIQCAVTGEDIGLMGAMVFVSMCLVISSMVPLVLICLNRWVIDRKLGGIMILMYILFIILDTYYELETSPPPCA